MTTATDTSFIVILAIVVVLVLWLSLRGFPSCSNCHRKRVAGRTICPFCGLPYQQQVSRQLTPPPSLPVQANVTPAIGPRLVCVHGPGIAREFSLQSGLVTIGRAKDNRIVVEGMLASRYHAQVSLREGQHVLVDRDSTNGTYVNNRRIAEHILKPGDRVQIGETIFSFQVGEEPMSHVSPLPSFASVRAPVVPSVVGRDLRTYRITGEVGSGAAATVYKGVSQIDQSPVAIKILKETDPIIRRKFEQEGIIGLGLEHPHIARIYHYGEEVGTYYIVMEYVDGGSLRQRLTPGSPAPIDFAKSVVGQTCEALAYAHGRKVVHRDIKPENLMLSTREGVKVVDFGIAKLTTAGTKTADGILIGTPYYMSYEQAKGLEVTPASDIYSLGVVLYEMVTGAWPFTGEPLAVVNKHLTENPVPPRQINPSVPPEIETVVMRALDKNARRRYQEALELASALGYQPDVHIAMSPVENLTTMPPMPREANLPISISKSIPSQQRVGMPRLVIVGGSAKGKEILLTLEIVTLGRNDIDSHDLVISRQHFHVISKTGQFWIEDAGSTNGTFVNGKRILERVALRSGDLIQTGQTILRFEE